MQPIERERLEQLRDQICEVRDVEQERLSRGLDPGDRKATVNAVFDLNQIDALLQKVIHS